MERAERAHGLSPPILPSSLTPHLPTLPLRLTSVGGDRTVFHWDVATGAIIRRWRGHDEGPPGANCVTPGPDDALYLTGGADTTVRAWDARSRSDVAVAVLRGAKDGITGVAVPNSGASAAAGGGHLPPPGGPSVSRPTGAPIFVKAATTPSSSSHEIVTASVDGCLRRYDLRAGQLTADSVGSPISSLALTKADNGATALVACLDGRLRLMDRETGALLASYTGHVATAGIRTDCVVVPPTDATVAVGSEDGNVVAWDLGSEKLTDRLLASPTASPITSVAVHPLDGRTMVTASMDGVVRVWGVGAGV